MHYRKRSFLIVMKVFGLLLSFAVSMPVLSQQTLRFHFDEQGLVVPPEHAAFYRIAEFDVDKFRFHGKVQDFFMDDSLKMTGTYYHGIPEGNFTFFFPNGNVESRGKYITGNRNGRWEYFYDNGQLKQVAYFSGQGHLIDFTITEFYNRSGRPLIQNGTGKWEIEAYISIPGDDTSKMRLIGKFKDSLKHGRFKLRRIEDNKLVASERFRHGKIEVLRLYELERNLRVWEGIEALGKFPDKYIDKLTTSAHLILDSNYFTPWQQSADCATFLRIVTGSEVLIPNRIPGQPYEQIDLVSLFKRNFRFNIRLMSSGIRGRVLVNVSIDAQGNPIDVMVHSSLHEGIDSEAKRLVRLINRWKPVIRDGIPVESIITVPIFVQYRRR